MKILALDIETSPTKAFVWSLWGQNITIDKITEPGKVLCWAAQWLGEKEMKYRRFDEPEFLSEIHALLNEADAVLTFNGRKFDVPHLNTVFLRSGMKPYSPVKHIDLFETVKKQFNFISNKMQYILTDLEIGTKLDHEGFPLWVKCLNNDPKAWKVMERYNKQDVRELIKLYKRLLPWIASHPNHNLYGATNACPTCGSNHLQSRGYARTNVGIFNRLQCQSCGHWSRTRFSEVPKEVKKEILVSVA